MLINEILTEKIQLKELGPDYSKAKTVTYNKVKYDWDKTTQTYTAPTGQQVPPGGDLYKQLLKTAGALPSTKRGLIPRGISALGRATGLSGVGMKARNDPKAGIFQKGTSMGLGAIGRALDTLTRKKPATGQPEVDVQGFPMQGDVKPLVDKNGKPLIADYRNDGVQSSHEFKFLGGHWQSLITGKIATVDQRENLNSHYKRKGKKNDTSDDMQNLRRQVELGNISQKDANEIIGMVSRREATTLNQAYQKWQEKDKPGT